MSSSTNLNDSSVTTQPPPKPVVRGLWRHYWQHLGVGILIWIAATLGGFAYEYLTAKAGFSSASEPDNVYFVASLLVFVPALAGAVVGGLLRQPLLAWLSRRARSRGALVRGAVVGFELTVVVSAVGLWWPDALDSKPLLSIWGSCILVSLPWLLSTAWLSWRLAYELNPALRPVTGPLAEIR